MRKAIFIAVSVIVSGAFLWLALRDVPLEAVGRSISEASPLWILVSFGTVGLALWTRGIRFHGLLGGRVTRLTAFYMFCATMFINLLPLRAGEVARVLLATRYGVPVMTTAAAIVVERLIDVLTVLLLLAYSLARLPAAPPAVSNAAILFAIATVVGFAVLLALARFPHIAHNLLVSIEGRVPLARRLHLRQRLEEVLDGLRPLTNWRSAAHVTFWTVVGWFVSLMTIYTLEIAFGIQGTDLWLLAALSLALASFGVAIPVTVAGIGPFQGAVRLAGEVMGISAIAAASLGIVFHAVTVLAYSIFGVISLIALGVSLGDLMRPAEAAKPAANVPLPSEADAV